MRTARFAIFLFALLSANVFAQSADAPLPGVARAAEAAYRHFSAPAHAYSPESARDVENLRNHALYISETDAGYHVRYNRFLWVGARGADGESLNCVVTSRRYRVDKKDFRLLEARERIFDGHRVMPEEVFPLSESAAAPKNAAPLPGFLRALVLAHRDFSRRRADSPRDGDPARHMRNFNIAVLDGADYYEVIFDRAGVIDGARIYRVDKRDFHFHPIDPRRMGG